MGNNFTKWNENPAATHRNSLTERLRSAEPPLHEPFDEEETYFGEDRALKHVLSRYIWTNKTLKTRECLGPSLERCFNDMKSCTEGLKNKVFTAVSKAKKIDRNCRPLLNDDLEKMQETRRKIDHEEGVIRKNKLVLEQIMLERVRSRGSKQREIELIKNSPKNVRWLVSSLRGV